MRKWRSHPGPYLEQSAMGLCWRRLQYCRDCNARFPPFRCCSSLCPFAVPVSRCRFGTPLPLPLPYALACRRRWLAGQLRNNGKIELDPISTEERKNGYIRQLFAVYDYNGTEFSYVFFYRITEFYNGRTAKRQRKNGNVMVETGHDLVVRFQRNVLSIR